MEEPFKPRVAAEYACQVSIQHKVPLNLAQLACSVPQRPFEVVDSLLRTPAVITGVGNADTTVWARPAPAGPHVFDSLLVLATTVRARDVRL